VDDCLNVRVLDPAMGSGYFLVEVVDYVSNRLIDFLNAWSENPVWAFLEKTRDDILNDMERQKVTIDTDRLTRVSLLKRAVLKRCVYGVDLNVMAVELAKVSLWLDAFTLGAPLSFLDHHLKNGNSLIGARITDVQDYLRGGGGPQQIDMFSGSEFAGVMLATDLMRQVSYQPDNTIEQTRQSAQAYHDARDHLAPYKRLLDVYTSRWFSNSRYATKKTDSLRLFLKDSQTKTWLRAPQTTLDDTSYPGTAIAENALRAAHEKLFFHWELEFPEVFFAPSRPGRQDVQLSADGGFDAVVGNPPWGGEIDKTTYEYLKEMFADLHQRLSDTTKYFFGVIHSVIKQFWGIGQIAPNVLLYSYEYENWRNLLLEQYILYDIINLGEGVFDDGTAPCCVITAEKSAVSPDHVVHVWELWYIQRGLLPQLPKEYVVEVSQEQFKQLPNHIFVSDVFGTQLLPRIYRLSDEVRKLASSISLGVHTGANEAYILSSKIAKQHDIELDARWKLLTGSDIERYYTEQSPPREILFVDWDFDVKSHPNTIRYLENFKTKLSQRREAKQGKMPWFALHWPRYIELYDSPKIMCRQTAVTLIATVDTYNYCALNSTIIIKPDSNDYSSYFWVAILNSRLQSYIYNLFAQEEDRAFAEVKPANLRKLPIRRITFTTSVDERERLTSEAIGAYDIGDNAGAVHRMQEAIDADKTDVVHDLLAHLAQRMIDLNKQKRGEIKRFLGWLEKRLQIRPDKNGATGIDSLTGKTILQAYLGDYQKGEDELPWREFHYRLYQNHNRFTVSLSDVEGEIQREYEKSLAALIPIKLDLARCDALLDKIVYRLYGLTDEEIELIERPQYEQALADAKAQVVADKAITDDEEKIEKIAEGILPAARRFFERVEPTSVEEPLDNELPNWRGLPPDAPTFLLTGDYNLRTLPDHMDFSTSIIPYTKAVEVVLSQLIFIPFRQHYTDEDCTDDYLKKFMRGEKDLTLGSFMIILSSSEEIALRNFISRMYADAATRVFGAQGLVKILNDGEMRDIRNKAAHDEVLSRDEAHQTRSWTLKILGHI
jgi:Eco57I restriction-modification methylase/TaqI-like C-terminal specificity domain